MSDQQRFLLDDDEVKFTFGEALKEAEKKSLIELEWDESQHPREPAGSSEGGQFAGGGGGGRGEGSEEYEAARAKGDPTSADALNKTEDHNVDHLIASVHGAESKVKEARVKLDKTIATDQPISKGGLKLANGNWTKERLDLHARILAGVLTRENVKAAKPAPGERPTIHFLGGRGGAGKSWFTKQGGKIDLSKSILLNNDEVKKELPEYQGWNAAQLHEESSEVGNQIEDIARLKGLNIVLDGTMRSPGSLQRRVDLYRKAGYRIEGHYMFASPKTAAQRALKRFVDGGDKGRFVPPEYSLSSTTNEKSFDSVRDKMDFWEVYDNNKSDFNPVLHSEGGTDFFKTTAGAVANYTPGIKASGDNNQVKTAKEAWFKGSPIKDIRQLVREAPSAQAELARTAAQVAAKVGVRWHDPGPKTKSASGIARVRFKASKRNGDVSRVTDVARGSFVIDRPEQAEQLAAELAKTYEVTLEDWKVTDVNYFDRTINLRLPNGMVAEIQMLPASMSLAKASPDHGGGGGHDIYKAVREIDPHESEAARTKYDELMGKMSELYGKVITDFPPIWQSAARKPIDDFAVLGFGEGFSRKRR
jgi:zeta toxin